MEDLWRDFWIRETGTGQQVAQLHKKYDDDDEDDDDDDDDDVFHYRTGSGLHAENEWLIKPQVTFKKLHFRKALCKKIREFTLFYKGET